jgi:hypothetical protein
MGQKCCQICEVESGIQKVVKMKVIWARSYPAIQIDDLKY